MPRKHHRWWQRSPAPSASGSTAQQPTPAQSTDPSRSAPPLTAAGAVSPAGIAERALALLDEGRRKILQEHTLGGAADALERAKDAAVEKRRECEARQWTVAVGNRVIALRQVADKVVALLDRFRAVGDVASNADPVHAGLPWAGVRFILEVAVSENRQMSALLFGMEMVLYMTRRVQAYMAYLERVPPCLERANFEDALVHLHCCILGFLASAIEAFGKRTASRVLGAFLSWDKYIDFQEKCLHLAERTETEARICDRVLGERDRDGAMDARKELADVLQQLEHLQVSVHANRVEVDLRRLPVAEGAEFDSYDEQHSSTCYPDTREDLLRQINSWITQPDGRMIFWLNGIAGTGKSTIARTVAQRWKEEGRLGASFFFKRGESDRGNGKRFFTTLVAQLFQNMSDLREPIVDILDSNPDIVSKHLQLQFEKLFLGCLEHNTINKEAPVVVIDALDECDESDATLILRLLRRMSGLVQLRVFVTSRPELPIRLGFSDMSSDSHQDLVLHQVEQSSIEHDILVVIRREFDKIRDSHGKRHPEYPLPPDWPGEVKLLSLVRLSVPLFIFAVTISRFIGDDRGDPVTRLDKILAHQAVSTSQLDQTYLPILEQLSEHEVEDEDDIDDVKRLLGCIAVLEEPLSVVSISRLLTMDERYVARKLDFFHSVLQIPETRQGHIRLFHLSFRDFLLQKDGQRMRHRFAVSEREVHQHLLTRCLELLGKPGTLHRDMCSLGRPGVRRKDVPQRCIDDSIAPVVSYACRYWTSHLVEMRTELIDRVRLHSFLCVHFLHWLESLSWLGRSSESLAQINSLSSVFTSMRSPDLFAFLEDARRFVIENRYITDLAPLQLYASCLVFAPDSSIIKQMFKEDVIVDLAFLPEMSHQWSSEVQKLEGHECPVLQAVFSPDGRMVASRTSDDTVRLWDLVSGHESLILKHDSTVTGIAFSRDGDKLMSSAIDRKLRSWNIGDGMLTHTITAEGSINTLAIPPDSETLVLLLDHGLYLHSAATGAIIERCAIRDINDVLFSSDGHKAALISSEWASIRYGLAGREILRVEPPGTITIAALSPDGTQLALVLRDEDQSFITLGTSDSSERTLYSTGCQDAVRALAFSPSGDLLASDSECAVIVLWQVTTGEAMLRLEGHGDEVNSLMFSMDGSLVLSTSSDETVRIWDISHVRLSKADSDTKRLATRADDSGPSGLESVRQVTVFSPNGEWLAAVLDRGGILMFQASTGRPVRKFETFGEKIWHLSISPDSESICFSADDDIITTCSIATGEIMWQSKAKSRPGVLCATSPDGTLAAFRDTTDSFTVLHLVTGRETRLSLPSTEFYNTTIVAFSYDNRVVAASCSTDLRCWDLQAETEATELKGWANVVTALAVSSDGQLVASASRVGTLRLWHASTGVELQRLEHEDMIYSISFCSGDTGLDTDRGVISLTQPDSQMT